MYSRFIFYINRPACIVIAHVYVLFMLIPILESSLLPSAVKSSIAVDLSIVISTNNGCAAGPLQKNVHCTHQLLEYHYFCGIS